MSPETGLKSLCDIAVGNIRHKDGCLANLV